MKKMFFAAIGVLGLTTAVCAQTPKPVSQGSLAKTTLIERAQGKIDAIAPANAAKSNFGKLTVVDQNGKKNDFSLIAKTQVYSESSAPISFSALKKGEKVVVLYVVTLKGLNDAITITQIK